MELTVLLIADVHARFGQGAQTRRVQAGKRLARRSRHGDCRHYGDSELIQIREIYLFCSCQAELRSLFWWRWRMVIGCAAL